MKTLLLLISITAGLAGAQTDLWKLFNDPDVSGMTPKQAYDAGWVRGMLFAMSNRVEKAKSANENQLSPAKMLSIKDEVPVRWTAPIIVRGPYFTNQLTDLRIETTLSTNWLPATLQTPNGDGTIRNVENEVGIVVSNRYARVFADRTTNLILLSSQAMPPKEFLIRERPPQRLVSITNFGWRDIPIWFGTNVTNGWKGL